MSIQLMAGLSLMPIEDFNAATYSLFDENLVDVIEWSFDMFWIDYQTPDWCLSILDDYSAKNRVLGHGVAYSPFSGGYTAEQNDWLCRLKQECEKRNYEHISEHFGFMAAGDFIRGAPLPVPMNQASVKLGIQNLEAISKASGRSVGLENLALAFCLDDVRNQGKFLDSVLKEVDGFLVLDLHNLYCQSVNFDIPAFELLESYPLDRVCELHLSGGSWSGRKSNPDVLVRRDTHDGPVPDEVFSLLDDALSECPNVQYVILERLGGTIDSIEEQIKFQDDYHNMLRILDAWRN